MKTSILIGILSISLFANAQAQIFATLCTTDDVPKITKVFDDMKATGFKQYLHDQMIGIAPEDCIAPFSLQNIAGRPDADIAPAPSCGIRLILNHDKVLAAEQAIWILDHLGSSYVTKDGTSIQLCARISNPTPVPGLTVHN